MKKHLIVTPTGDMPKDEWIAFRRRGIGASEVGTIMGLNPYKSSLELFHEKISLYPKISIENINMFMGHYQESHIAELWQYWEGSQESVIENYRTGKIIRKCRRSNGYVQNPKYPWLFVSLDRIINKTWQQSDGGKWVMKDDEGALEIKTISGYESNKWESGIPTSHLMQVVTQMLVCEFTFGEIAVLKDGRYLDVYPFEFNQTIADAVIEHTSRFWQRVEKARVVVTQRYEAVKNYNMRLADEKLQELNILEPPPDGSEAYERFMKDKYKKSMAEVGLIPGTEVDRQIALKYLELNEQIKKLEEQKRMYSTQLMARLRDGNKLDFGKNGYVSWRGEPRKFIVKVK